MAVRGGSRTTICITTLDRPKFIERTLSYYADQGFDGVILIGDGSRGANATENRRLVELHASRMRVHWIDGSARTQAETMSDMAEKVATEYAVYSGDDDYLIPNALAECEQFLDEHADFVAARGAGIALNADGAHGVPASLDPYVLPNIWQEDALVRLERFLMNYSVAIFALHRASAWREMFREARYMTDKAIAGEVAPCVVSAVLGKCAQLNGLYLVRQIHTRRYHLPLLDQWVLDPRFGESLKRLLAQVRALIAERVPTTVRAQIEQRTWHAVMGYFFREFHLALPEYATAGLRSRPDDARLLDQGSLLEGRDSDANRYQAVFRSVAGERLLEPGRPRLLLSWGNPYVLDETITPILPDLASRFSIVLLLVDYRLSPHVRDKAFAWKDEGLVEDVLIAPSHGGSIAAHLYMWHLLPAIRRLGVRVLLSISAMQPYERYLIECGLPRQCLRILFWPHPTNLFLYPELGQALIDRRPRDAIDAIVKRIRRRIEPNPGKELRRPSPGLLRIWGFFLTLGMRKVAALWARLPLFRRGISAAGSASKNEVVKGMDDGGSPITRFLLRNPWIRPYGQAVTRVWPALRFWIEDIARFAHRMYKLYRARAELVGASQYGGAYGAWFGDWPTLGKLNVSRTERYFYYLLDRIIYPKVLVGRRFPLKKLDWITQLGTDDFDACMFFNDQDSELHKVLYASPNMYTVRYVPRSAPLPAEPLNAILLPFSVHAKADLTPQLLEIYRRDLGIALKESGADEVHIRPHPGALEDWLDFLVEELRMRNVPCKLVSASRPVSEEAARYKGIVSAVSGSLRDARLACPHIFVVGSVGLSITNFKDPKRVVGFPDSIGWIEADGSYDPKIFRPAAENSQRHPTAAEVVVDLFEGRWARTPDRLQKLARDTATAAAGAPS